MLNILQGGRGLAAIAVLLLHTSITVKNLTGIAPYWEVTQFGGRGVDFFFVLSGFILMRAHKTHIGQPKMWKNFVKKRFIRIFPIYWFYTLLVVIALTAGLGNFPLPQTGADWLTTFSLLPITDVSTPLPQAWSLFHEMIFYIGFLLLILNRPLGCAFLASWFIASAASLEVIPESGDPTLVVFNSYNINFALGIGAYYAVSYIKRMELLVAGIGLSLVLFATTIIGVSSFAIFGFGCALLIAASASFEENRRLNIPIAALLGNASYSIYLTHEVGIVVSVKVTQALNITNPHVLFFIISLSSLVLGILAYHVIERPLLALLRSEPWLRIRRIKYRF